VPHSESVWPDSDSEGLWTVPPEADVELVRFGQGQPHILAARAWEYASGRGDGAWGLSVWWWPTLTPDEIVWRAWRLKKSELGVNPFAQSVYRCWTRRALHEFDLAINVRATYGPGHYTVELSSFLLEQDFNQAYHGDRSRFPAYEYNARYFDELSNLLGPPIPNPVRKL
jgi:hypothetical protein